MRLQIPSCYTLQAFVVILGTDFLRQGRYEFDVFKLAFCVVDPMTSDIGAVVKPGF